MTDKHGKSKEVSRRHVLVLMVSLTMVSVNAGVLEGHQQKPDSHFSKADVQIVLDVLVRRRSSGQAILGLTKKDFTVHDADVEQIVEEAQQGTSASIVLLLDLSGSMDPVISLIRDGAKNVWEELRADDEVAIMTYAKSVEMVQGFTRNKSLIGERIHRIYTSPGIQSKDGTSLDEAMYQASAYLSKSSSPEHHRFVLVISDGRSYQLQGHTKKEALHSLFASGGVVSALLVSDAPSLFPVFSLTLFEYVSDTGGIYETIQNEVLPYLQKREIDEKLLKLIGSLQDRYRITYRTSNQKLDGKFRKLRVKVAPEIEKRWGKLEVLSRKGYYAE